MARSVGIVFSNIHDKEVNELTEKRTLASVPFGGRYRLIDFVLSNMVNSGITNVGVITKYNYQSLMNHVGSGKSWDLSRKNGGLTLLPPFGNNDSSKVYSSRFEAISNVAYYLRERTEKYVVMSDCDNVCTIDFTEVVDYHESKDADITVVYRKKRIGDIIDKKVRTKVTVEADGRVSKVVNSSNNTGTIDVFVNILVINRDFLLKIIDNAEEMGYKSFSRDVLIKGVNLYRIYGFEYDDYFASIDSMSNYYKHSMQLLDKTVREELFRKKGSEIYTSVRDSAPCKITGTAKVSNSLIADGCIIEGEVTGSILFRGVKVAKGAVVRNSVLFQNTEVGENSKINCVITDKNVRVLGGRMLSGHDTHPSFICEDSVI